MEQEIKVNINSNNHILNVPMAEGIIPLFGISPQRILNRKIKSANDQGWKVIQIIPSQTGNMLITILRFMILLLTLFLYTPANGFYIVLEKSKKDEFMDELESNLFE